MARLIGGLKFLLLILLFAQANLQNVPESRKNILESSDTQTKSQFATKKSLDITEEHIQNGPKVDKAQGNESNTNATILGLLDGKTNTEQHGQGAPAKIRAARSVGGSRRRKSNSGRSRAMKKGRPRMMSSYSNRKRQGGTSRVKSNSKYNNRNKNRKANSQRNRKKENNKEANIDSYGADGIGFNKGDDDFEDENNDAAYDDGINDDDDDDDDNDEEEDNQVIDEDPNNDFQMDESPRRRTRPMKKKPIRRNRGKRFLGSLFSKIKGIFTKVKNKLTGKKTTSKYGASRYRNKPRFYENPNAFEYEDEPYYRNRGKRFLGLGRLYRKIKGSSKKDNDKKTGRFNSGKYSSESSEEFQDKYPAPAAYDYEDNPNYRPRGKKPDGYKGAQYRNYPTYDDDITNDNQDNYDYEDNNNSRNRGKRFLGSLFKKIKGNFKKSNDTSSNKTGTTKSDKYSSESSEEFSDKYLAPAAYDYEDNQNYRPRGKKPDGYKGAQYRNYSTYDDDKKYEDNDEPDPSISPNDQFTVDNAQLTNLDNPGEEYNDKLELEYEDKDDYDQNYDGTENQVDIQGNMDDLVDSKSKEFQYEDDNQENDEYEDNPNSRSQGKKIGRRNGDENGNKQTYDDDIANNNLENNEYDDNPNYSERKRRFFGMIWNKIKNFFIRKDKNLNDTLVEEEEEPNPSISPNDQFTVDDAQSTNLDNPGEEYNDKLDLEYEDKDDYDPNYDGPENQVDIQGNMDDLVDSKSKEFQVEKDEDVLYDVQDYGVSNDLQSPELNDIKVQKDEIEQMQELNENNQYEDDNAYEESSYDIEDEGSIDDDEEKSGILEDKVNLNELGEYDDLSKHPTYQQENDIQE